MSITFLYTQQTENVLKWKILFITASKTVRCLQINWTKTKQDEYPENYETLLKEYPKGVKR